MTVVQDEMKMISLPCHPRHLKKAREFVSNILGDIEVSNKERFAIELSLDEASMNAIDHGSAINAEMHFDIRCGLRNGKLILLIKDYGGKPFDPNYFEKLAGKKSWGYGGRGISIIKQLMDEVMYSFHKGESTTVCMIKQLTSISSPAADNQAEEDW
ncbi:MAG: ATP-binding protein [bacterium]|jgi:serine/threonine-protein kinase RsbW|nr:ATP-binding protein [bacterium]